MAKSRFQDTVIAITGASGALGQALIHELRLQGATVIALTSSVQTVCPNASEVVQWQVGAEDDLRDRLQSVDILILNHGVNVYGDRTPAAIHRSLEVNALSHWRLAELFFQGISPTRASSKELWVNTSEAEVSPALSPLYEISKRLTGQLMTLRTLDAPCVVRKLILGPFKSNLNPYGVMTPQFVAWAIAQLAHLNFRLIIITINPLTYLLFPLQEGARMLYFKLFSQSKPKQIS
ncbi:MAG: NAD-dependent epimerase/dehydratase family protein [Leptolyngbyaceae bacterium]|nr:NAD-dependent epimerase/dehydratase family protein [Leptolyngbyaceae bacterium]